MGSRHDMDTGARVSGGRIRVQVPRPGRGRRPCVASGARALLGPHSGRTHRCAHRERHAVSGPSLGCRCACSRRGRSDCCSVAQGAGSCGHHHRGFGDGALASGVVAPRCERRSAFDELFQAAQVATPDGFHHQAAADA